MKNIPLLLSVLVGTLALVIGISLIFSKQASAPVDLVRVYGDSRNATGSAVPKVRIVEFSDLQCPACKQAHPMMKQVVQKYEDKVQLVYRHYPLESIHKNAMLASRVSEVMAQQGIFWPFIDMMYDKQSEWSELSNEAAQAKFIEYAATFNVKKEVVDKGLADESLKSKIVQDVADGNAVGIAYTPTFFVNGVITSPQDLMSTVEKSLKQE